MAGTMEGLAQPLYGGYTTYLNNSTTAVRTQDEYGVFKHEVAWTTSSTQVSAIGSWASFYAAGNFKSTVTGDTGNKWLSGLTASLDDSSTSAGHNAHGATIGYRSNADLDNSGGSCSVLALLYEEETGATTPANAGFAWLNLYNIDTATGQVPSLMQLHIAAADTAGGMWFTSDNTVINHALRIYINNTVYYIGLYDALCT